MTARTKQNKDRLDFQRIVVALDESLESRAALEAAAHLASVLGREILGVFVEDQNLLNLAQLPLASEYRWGSRSGSGVPADTVQAGLRIQAERARKRLLQAAARAQVTSHFEVSRGCVADELRGQIRERDLLILGRTGRSPRLRKRLGSTASSLCKESVHALMLVRSTPSRVPLLILYENLDQREQAIQLANRLKMSQETSIRLVESIPVSEEEKESLSKAPSLSALQGFLVRQSGIVISRFPRELCEFPALERFLQETEAQVILLKKGRLSGTRTGNPKSEARNPN